MTSLDKRTFITNYKLFFSLNNTRINVIKSQVQDTEHAINEMLQGSSGLEQTYDSAYREGERYLCWSCFLYDHYYYLSISQCIV